MEPDFPTTTRLHPLPPMATPFMTKGYTIRAKGYSHPKVPVKTYKIYINVYF